MSKHDDSPEEFSSPDPRDPSFETSDGPHEWVSEEDIKALADEREVFAKDEVTQAEDILRENLPMAVHSIAKLARSASSETVRLGAAKYLVDRNLGRIGDPEPEGDSPTEKLLDGIVVRG